MHPPSAELEDLIDDSVTIPTVPAILLEITEICNSSTSSTLQAARVIEQDPALAAKVLQLANSAIYSLKHSVSSIRRACTMLGLEKIRNVVVQAQVVDSFRDKSELGGLSLAWLWDHSFKAAVAAMLLAQQAPPEIGLPPEDAYSAGLIHDVGKIILVHSQRRRFAEALHTSRALNLALAKVEGPVLGYSHAHVGGLLASRWKLPRSLQVAVMYHHSPGTDASDWVKGFLVSAANSLAHKAADGNGGWIGDVMPPESLDLLGLTDTRLQEIVEQVRTVRCV